MPKALLILLIVVSILLAINACYCGYRYSKYSNIMGHYELVEGTGEKEMSINLTTWTQGKKENLKCDLWNCTGYEHGTYKTKGNKIEFHFESVGYITFQYELINEKGETFLVLKDSNEANIIKYKKIK